MQKNRVLSLSAIAGLIVAVLSLGVFVSPVFAEVDILDVYYYPGTNIEMLPGDLIYAPKSPSTKIVGHVAIVGTDYKIYHSYPNANGYRIDTPMDYFNLFSKGEILRVKSGNAGSAARKAQEIITQIKKYDIQIDKLGIIPDNYCSKFVWQAYWFGTGNDIVSMNYTDQTIGLVTPNNIKNGNVWNLGNYSN